jgi:hypothetical protein
VTGEDSRPIDEVLFDMVVMVCKQFPALDPLRIRRERAIEVFGMVNKMLRHVRRENSNYITIRGKRILKRKVQNDSWF